MVRFVDHQWCFYDKKLECAAVYGIIYPLHTQSDIKNDKANADCICATIGK